MGRNRKRTQYTFHTVSLDRMKEKDANKDGKSLAFNGWDFELYCFQLKKPSGISQNFNAVRMRNFRPIFSSEEGVPLRLLHGSVFSIRG